MNTLTDRECKVVGWLLVICFGILALCNGILAVAGLIKLVI